MSTSKRLIRLPHSRLKPLPQLQHRRQRRSYSAPPDSATSIPPSKLKYVPQTGTYAQGFQAGTAHAGVKASNTRHDDVCVIASSRPCNAAAVFTRNRFQAAPVTVSREVLRRSGGQGVRAVVVNSGCANAVTGKGGLEDAEKMAGETERCLREEEEEAKEGNGETLVMSTGVIGQRLPIRKILPSISRAHSSLGSTHSHWLRAARSICTTDTFPKLLSQPFTLPSFDTSTTFHLTGIVKGAGMIHPNMGTLLSIVCTDVPIAAPALHPLLSSAVTTSFNRISVDGDTSTNDTVALLANGAALPSHNKTTISDPTSPAYTSFQNQFTAFLTRLSHLVVRDGEGATKFITIRVLHAHTDAAAARVAESVARSPLVKTALYGRDANWGRVLCAVGYANTSGADDEVVPGETSVSFCAGGPSSSISNEGKGEELRLLTNGEPEDVDEERAAEVLAGEEVEIVIRLCDEGRAVREARKGTATYWTCDLSHEYVTINGDYRT